MVRVRIDSFVCLLVCLFVRTHIVVTVRLLSTQGQ
jgi:hypothetical protein